MNENRENQAVIQSKNNADYRSAAKKVISPGGTDSWLHYLPGVYEEKEPGSFTERFLMVFQVIYEEINHLIREFPIRLCPEVCEAEYLPILADWLDIKTAYFWKEDQLRYLLSHIMEFYENRGTPDSICWLAGLYTGERPFLIEYYAVEKEREGKGGISSQRSRSIRRLYGENPFRFTLLVQKEHKALPKILEEVIPAHMKCEIVVLQPRIRLNGYAYMGINSRI